MQGYDELDTLERPLVSAIDGGDDGENNESGVERQRNDRLEGGAQVQQAVFVPSQHEELEMLTVLSKDAAEILWEMVLVSNGDDLTGDVDLEDMRGRAKQLRAQLRGMLNDYDGSDEVLMCGALEAFDSLNSALNNNSNEIRGEGENDRKKDARDDILVGDRGDRDVDEVAITTQQSPTPQGEVPNLIDF